MTKKIIEYRIAPASIFKIHLFNIQNSWRLLAAGRWLLASDPKFDRFKLSAAYVPATSLHAIPTGHWRKLTCWISHPIDFNIQNSKRLLAAGHWLLACDPKVKRDSNCRLISTLNASSCFPDRALIKAGQLNPAIRSLSWGLFCPYSWLIVVFSGKLRHIPPIFSQNASSMCPLCVQCVSIMHPIDQARRFSVDLSYPQEPV